MCQWTHAPSPHHCEVPELLVSFWILDTKTPQEVELSSDVEIFSDGSFMYCTFYLLPLWHNRQLKEKKKTKQTKGVINNKYGELDLKLQKQWSKCKMWKEQKVLFKHLSY